MSLHIEGRRWFRRSAGNTYCSSRIYRDGELVATLGPTGGYGDYPLQIAVEWLRKNGYPEMEYGTRYLREEMKSTYTVADVSREKDL